MNNIAEVMAKQLEWMVNSLEWQPWAAKGWTLHPAPGRCITAVNEARKMAVDPAKRLDTIVRRLTKGQQTYFHYMKFRKHTR